MDPVAVMLQGDEIAVNRAVSHCIAVAGATTCIAAGCEIPAATPEAYLLLMDTLLYRCRAFRFVAPIKEEPCRYFPECTRWAAA